MDAIVVIAILALFAAVVYFVGQPLRAGTAPEEDADASARAALEAAKEAKYREIRDAEMDHRTGKLDDTDWRAVDRQLRAEAVDLLRQLDALGSATANDEPADR